MLIINLIYENTKIRGNYMINLLIVDDETFSREGIAEMLPINDLGITNIQQAFDGVNALEIIKNFEPDILLTDVKMPRMNGIDLSFEVRKIYPNCFWVYWGYYNDRFCGKHST